jgi:hypothetical protein
MCILKDGININNIYTMKLHGNSCKVYMIYLALRGCLFMTSRVMVKLPADQDSK